MASTSTQPHQQHHSSSSGVLATFKYHNPLPYPPGGLFFKDVPRRPKQDLGIYRASTLERNYDNWLHPPATLGLRIDFVDQHIASSSGFDMSEDQRYLREGQLVSTAKDVDTSQHWWVRSTQAYNNDIHSVFNTREVFRNAVMKQDVNPFTCEFINDSFTKANEVQERLIEAKAKAGVKLEATYDILPVKEKDGADFFLMSFTEDPLKDCNQSSDRKRKRMTSSVLCNTRASRDISLSRSMALSLVALTGDESDLDSHCHNASRNEQRDELKWVSDVLFSKSIKTDQEVIVMSINHSNSTKNSDNNTDNEGDNDSSSDSLEEPGVTYRNVRVRWQLDPLKDERDVSPMDLLVLRK